MILAEEYIKIRNYSKVLCDPLKTEDYIVQIEPFVSPIKWHLAHTTWFFEIFILKKYLKNYIEYNSNYNFLFNSYYNNIGNRILRENRGNLSRPTIEEIYTYRAYVDENMSILLKQIPDKSLEQLIILGLNHEQQHQELILTDVKYMFGNNPLFPIYNNTYNSLQNIEQKKINIPIKGGIYEIGHKEASFLFR